MKNKQSMCPNSCRHVLTFVSLCLIPACAPSPALIQTAIAQTQTIQPVVLATTPPVDGQIGTVTHVIDGDTIDVDINGQVFRVRYIGVDTPERDETCYAEATAANSELVLNQVITLRKDISNTDRFDRLLRYVYKGDIFINAEMVRLGFAEAKEYRPDIAQADFLEGLELQARASNLACYAMGVFDEADSTTQQAPLATQPPIQYDSNGDGKVTCADFSTHAEAQEAYSTGQTELDGNDGDGQACETLPY
jgi:endonuclease YncB( thermonuclease family)